MGKTKYTTSKSYAELFTMMLKAASLLSPTKAALIGLHWGRWEARQNFNLPRSFANIQRMMDERRDMANKMPSYLPTT